jgi:sorting nexin-29
MENRKEKLIEHYARVLNAPPSNLPILSIPGITPAKESEFNLGKISATEVRQALHRMKSDAAAGLDNIPPRVLKLPELTSIITTLLNMYSPLGGVKDARSPTTWRSSKIISIPKKGPSKSLDNQRGIALECTLPKLLNSILRARLVDVIDPLLLPVQSGFRSGRSTTEQIASVRSIIETCTIRHRSVSIVFVDFRKAFDSIDRHAIPLILQAYGVPELLITAIMDMYKDTTAFVQIGADRTEDFRTTSGVLQGDTLAPFLFIVVLDYILRRSLEEGDGYLVARRRSRRHPAVTITALAFADDIALTCGDPNAAQRALRRLCDEAERVGLVLNASKTEVMHVGLTDAPPLTLSNGDCIAECKDFRYLGSLISSPDSIVADRRAQAWRAAVQLSPIFRSRLDDALKLRIMRTAVEPIFMYGLEAVPLTASREADLEICAYRGLLRYALDVRRPQTLADCKPDLKTALPSISNILRLRRQRLLGHVLRRHGRGESNPLALVILNPPQEGFRRGKAGTAALIDTFSDDLRTLNLTPLETTRLQSHLFRDRLRARNV